MCISRLLEHLMQPRLQQSVEVVVHVHVVGSRKRRAQERNRGSKNSSLRRETAVTDLAVTSTLFSFYHTVILCSASAFEVNV